MPGGGTGNRRKIIFVLGLLLSLIAAALAWFFTIRPMEDPYFLTIPIREYKARPFPANSLADQDSEILLQHFLPDKREKAYESQERERLRLKLSNLKKMDGPLVVHICALARMHEGEVYVLPGDAHPDRPESWLALQEILQFFSEGPSRRLLILDLARPLADPRLGVLADQVAQGLADALAKLENPNLLVLCSSSPGQLALVSEDLGGQGLSVFGYYLDQGLSGHADGFGGGVLDQRISVKELAAFVEDRVDRWAWLNRGARQTPKLWGQGRDFPLTSFDQEQLVSAKELPDLTPYPAWLAQAWEERDRAWNEESYRLAPREFRHLEAAALRAEQRWRGGIEAARIQKEWAADLARFQEQVRRMRSLPGPRPLSLYQTEDAEKHHKPLVEHLRTLWTKAQEITAKPEELKKTKDAFAEKFKDLTPGKLAWNLFNHAADQPSTSPEQIVLWQDLVQGLSLREKYLEAHFLKRLSDFAGEVKDRGWENEWKKAPLAKAWAARREAERILATVAKEPFLWPLIEKSFLESESLRRAGEKSFLEAFPQEWTQAGILADGAARKFRELSRRIDIVLRARRDLDEAHVILPALALYLGEVNSANDVQMNAWKESVALALRALENLAQINLQANFFPEDPTAQLRQRIRDGMRFYKDRAQRFTERPEDAPAQDYQEFQAILESPLLSAHERQNLYLAGRKWARKLHGKTRDLDQEDFQKPSRLPLGNFDQAAQERDRALRRARLASDLLYLAGYQGLEPLKKSLDETRDQNSLHILAKKMQEAWSKHIFSQYQGSEKNLEAADRLSRILPPLDQEKDAVVRPGHWSHNPAGALRQRHLEAFSAWMENRFREESQHLSGEKN